MDYEGLTRRFAWLEAMKGCQQDPVHHAEGDVWTHVGLVLEALVASQDWRSLPEQERETLFWAALLHDVAKPATTERDAEGRLRSPGHSGLGARMARRTLWELGVPMRQRETVCGLILHHQLPFWLLEREDPRRPAFAASQVTRCDLLALLAEADARGRECGDRQDLLERVHLFRDFCAEEGCLDRPRAFASDHGRVLYFREQWPDPDTPPYERLRGELVLMSGMPGAGKDTWIAENLPDLPLVSLDALRRDLRISPTADQGAVVSAAWGRGRQFLRMGRSFVWNATNVTRRLRQRVRDLALDYGARVRIVYVEATEDDLWERNRTRDEPVPERVLDRLLDKWEVPDPTEAHALDWVIPQ